MRRTYLALLLAPVIVSGLFGIFALMALPMMLLITGVVALPLLLWFRRIEQLNWWIAVTGGAVSALIFVLGNTLTPKTYGVTPNFDRLIDANNIAYIGVGMLTGFVFWWLGIFRNAAFPFVSQRFPASTLIAIPLAFGFAYLNLSLRETYVQGRVISIDVPPTQNYLTGQATIKLTAGPTIRADLSNTWPSSMIQGRCVHVENRWSTLRYRRVYEVDGPFGGGGDDC